MRTIALRLDPETRRKLEILAQATGCRRELLVAEAVRRFVDAELETLAALQKETGEKTGPDDDTPPPPERWNLIV
jgi:predicted transcriptional regulator